MSPIARRRRFWRARSFAGVRSGTLAFNSAAKTSSSASILAMVSGLILPTRSLGFFRFAMVLTFPYFRYSRQPLPRSCSPSRGLHRGVGAEPLLDQRHGARVA